LEVSGEQITAVIARALRIPYCSITDQLEYKSILEWDSFGHVGLLLALENAFGVSIDSSMTLKLTSVAAIKTFIQCAGQQDTRRIEANATPVHHDKAETGSSPVTRCLERTFFDYTQITKIDIVNADILYRGYSLHDLAEHSTFEETAFLLLFGALPTPSELKQFDATLKSAREVPPEIIELLRLVKDHHPLHALRTAVSALPTFESSAPTNGQDYAAEIRLISQIPTIVSAHHRIRAGLPVVPPNDSMTHAENFLYMFFHRDPSSVETYYIEKDLIVHADHSSTPSTFAARVAAATQADLHASITAAIAAFGGELHGFAPESVIRLLEEVGTPENAKNYVERKLTSKHPIPGFGHRIYRFEDPRVQHLRDASKKVAKAKKSIGLLTIAEAVIEAMAPYAQHGINVNDDLYSSIALNTIGIPEDALASFAIASRIVGLLAHVSEQHSHTGPIAASLKYAGRTRSSYIPVEQRE
jgi:citrate synthase/acyl carrier protein